MVKLYRNDVLQEDDFLADYKCDLSFHSIKFVFKILYFLQKIVDKC